MKKHSSWLLIVLLFTAAVTLMTCGTGPSTRCNATLCPTGCCDTKDVCQLGNSTPACGKGGTACGICTTGQVCKTQACSANTGGGSGGAAGGEAAGGGTGGAAGGGTGGAAGGGTGGAAGGGTGGAAGGGTGGAAGGGSGGGSGGGAAGGSGGGSDGGSAACQTIPFFPQVSVLDALYRNGSDGGDVYNSGLIADTNPNTSPDGGHSEYLFEIYYFNGATLGAHTLTATKNATCEYCLYLDVACDLNYKCARSFLAQSGAINITTATKNEKLGRMTATATNLHFTQWNFTTDKPVDGGQCIIVSSAPIDVSWDGGKVFQGDGGPP